MDRIADIPGRIIHGRYDMVCRCLIRSICIVGGRLLSCTLSVTPATASEPGTVDALIRATEEIGNSLLTRNDPHLFLNCPAK